MRRGLVNQTVTLGPASTDGTVYFTATHQEYGEGAPAPVTGSYPDYNVYTDDGCCGGSPPDYNDVVLSVHVTREPGKLTCTPKDPTRGQTTVNCIVTGTGVAVTSWKFVAQAYDDPNTFWRVTGPTSGNSWKGLAVVSGDVTAEATVNGVPRSRPLTASFSVQRRTGNSWSWGPGLHWQHTRGSVGAQPNCFAGDPREPLLYSEGKIFGFTARKNTCDDHILTPDPFTDSTSGYSVKQVSAGPNTGLWYVSGITYKMLIWSTINAVMTSGSSRKWTLADQGEISLCSVAARKNIKQANFYFFNETCKNNDVDALIAGVWNHEEYGAADGNGHQAQLERGAHLDEYELYMNEEQVYGFDQSSIRESVIELAQNIVRGLRPIWLNHSVVRDNWSPKTFWFWIASPPHFSDLLVADQP